ncbi:hypothetical protein [Pseudonocardia humida]|uniref:Uncharacterized protein n=1 Tax=Pseudonocardia humida TaxID=2800819 RepID=A0ABT1AB77_9PSEU|nr:hypothetical protein [Pseudonocardia humida]MCO1660186.1 hypothetical protein [Pseudonocardia humida]
MLVRNGDAGGFGVDDPADGLVLTHAPLPAPGGEPEVTLLLRGGATAVLLTVPAGVDRLEIAPVARPGGAVPCTISEGLAVCTIDEHPNGQAVVVTAFRGPGAPGVEVYRG